MTMAERPEHALVLDVVDVLRALGDRQLEFLAVVRKLRADFEARQVTSGLPTTTLAPPGPLSAALIATVPSTQPVGEAVPATAPPPPQSPQTAPVAEAPSPPRQPTLTTKRDYDYFDELDARLAQLGRDSHDPANRFEPTEPSADLQQQQGDDDDGHPQLYQ
jgi:hypothetical protein